MAYRYIFLLLSAISITACSTTTPRFMPSINMDAMIQDDETAAWRNCHFRIAWPEDSEPRWGVDLLLAHKIMGPVLSRHGDNLHRWRFHRRANRDDAGHLFTFVFYTGTPQAQGIIEQIQQNEWRNRLLENNILESAECENPENMSRPDISDGSDSHWSESMQKHWPAYIMGVSNLWLGLIDDAMASMQVNETDLDQVIQDYDKANLVVTSIWQKEGQHALLHHLNAVFGYEEMLIRY